MLTVAGEEIQESRSGKFIALEGDANVISTQLRLLPPSQKILVLPNLLECLAPDEEQDTFNSRAFIRDLQVAVTQRTETARQFLQSSTPTQPRLVFAVYGSVGARTTCIAKISQNVTNGNIEEAESIFNDLVKDGIAGLEEFEKDPVQGEAGTEESQAGDNEQEKAIETSDEVSLDTVDSQQQERETAVLIYGGPALERLPSHIPPPRSRVLDLVSGRGLEQPKKSGIPMYKFASPTIQPEDKLVRTVLTVPSPTNSLVERRAAFGPYQAAASIDHRTDRLLHQSEEDTDAEDELYTPNVFYHDEESGLFVPQVPGGVESGEGCLMDVQPGSPMRVVKRAQSVGKLGSSNSLFEDCSSNAHQLKQTKSHYHLRDNPHVPATGDESRQDTSLLPILPGTISAKAPETSLGKSSTSAGSSRSLTSLTSSTESPDRALLVGRGTDASGIPIEGPKDVPFVPVFELVEDIVIHFTDDLLNDIFESVVRSYKNGTYPIIPLMHSSIGSPTSHTGPTEAMPPLPAAAEDSPLENRFVDFSPVNPGNAISVQNSFRELLGILFPASDNYSQYLYSVASEADRLWKPVFGNEESGPIGIEGRTVDQIIALGYEEGVKQDFFYQISGQIEMFGMERKGFNRSGKLDIRYLTQIVMQGYINSSVAQQVSSPISDPKLLASLLVPHIEAFLASNTSVRLLILHYTSAELATMFALRELLGTELFKIGGILDSLASDPPSISRPGTSMSSRPRMPSPAKTLETLTTWKQSRQPSHLDSINTLRRSSVTRSLDMIRPQAPKPVISFSKADYLLPNTATDSEIATFLSGMWKALMEKSSFYTPEPKHKLTIIERPPSPPAPFSNGPRDRDPRYLPPSHQTPRASKVSRLTGGAATDSMRGGNYAPSLRNLESRGHGGGHTASAAATITNEHKYSASIASTKTTASDRERKRGDKEWDNFNIAEEDSEDDAYDKMILGRGMQRIVPEVRKVGQKANTKKALKCLGLA